MSSRHARRKAGGLAQILAVASVIMICCAVGAAFVLPPGKPLAHLPPAYGFGRFALPPLGQPARSTSPTTARPIDYAKPVKTYPAPARTYPAPARIYPAPAPATVTVHDRPSRAEPATSSAKPSSTPADPAAGLPPPSALQPPLAGVVTTDVAGWDAITASHAQLAVQYVSMSAPLAPSWLHSAIRTADGAEVVIELLPTSPGQPPNTLEQIAAGVDDGWLTQLHEQITAIGYPVVISFAPEANGRWYAWGEDPAGFAAAWRHVHALLGIAGITWMWQISAHNIGDPATADIGAYWPGTGQADWAGLDGYDYQPGDGFTVRFGHSLTELKTWWHGPVLIAETAVSPLVGSPAAQAADVTDLFAGVAANGLIGLIYLDLNVCQGECSLYKQDFRLSSYPQALNAYRTAVNGAW